MDPAPPKTSTPEALVGRLRELAPQIASIQGWLHDNAGGLLYQLAHLVPPSQAVVELGSWKGRSTAWLGFGMKDRNGGKLVAVDTWKGTAAEPGHAEMLRNYGPDQLFDEFRGNMARLGLADHVEPWRMTTIEAARRWDRGPIGVLHIDASHEYLDVRADFEHWAPHVATGGYIVFDDVPSFVGPTRLVTELPRWFQFQALAPNQICVRKLDQ